MFNILSKVFIEYMKHSKLDLITENKHLTAHTIFHNTYQEVLRSWNQHL